MKIILVLMVILSVYFFISSISLLTNKNKKLISIAIKMRRQAMREFASQNYEKTLKILALSDFFSFLICVAVSISIVYDKYIPASIDKVLYVILLLAGTISRIVEARILRNNKTE